MADEPLLWYVHHHGSGHWRRALAVSRQLSQSVVFASSAPPPSDEVDWVRLPLDTPADTLGDATAHGRLHWAPPRQPGLLARHQCLLDLVEEHRPTLAVVDVSVEVALLLRVSGLPIATIRLPGERTDAAHDLVHAIADRVVLPVPGSWGMAAGGATAVGLVSALTVDPVEPGPDGPVLVLLGTGGSALGPEHCRAIAQAAAGRPVVVAGAAAGARIGDRAGDWAGDRAGDWAGDWAHDPAGYADDTLTWLGHLADPAALIAEAAVVVGGAGLGTVADMARIGRPFVCVPADRPFGEQRATAAALARHEAVCVLDAPPTDATAWAVALRQALSAGPLRADTGGAKRLADLLNVAAQ